MDYEEWKFTNTYMKECQADTSISSAFLLEWLGVRCRANDVLHTPIGYICLGKTPAQDHPFFALNAPVASATLTDYPTRNAFEELENDEWEESENGDWGEDIADEK